MSTVRTDPALEELAREARSLGFIHITGLELYLDDPTEPIGIVQARPQECGLWGTCREEQKTVAVFLDGQVWFTAQAMSGPIARFVDRACPRGTGAKVPCCDGEHLDLDAVLDRVANPYSGKHGDPSPNTYR